MTDSGGRVQTAVLALLTDRKKERDLFEPKTYYNACLFYATDVVYFQQLLFYLHPTHEF